MDENDANSNYSMQSRLQLHRMDGLIFQHAQQTVKIVMKNPTNFL